MSESRTINSVKNIAMGLFGQGFVYVIGFINRIIFIRFLSETYLGINALFSNVLSLLSLAELGIGTAIVYALYKPLAEKDEEQISILMKFYAKAYKIIGAAVCFIGLCILPFLDNIITDKPNIDENMYLLYLIALGNVVLSYFFSYKSSLLNADQKNYILTLVNIVTVSIQCVLQTVVLMVTRNFILYLLCQSFCTLMYNFIISYITTKKYTYICNDSKKNLDETTKKQLIHNVKALVVIKLSGVLVNSTDNIILTALKGLNLTGINSNYVLLTSSLQGVLNTIFNAMTASIGNANVLLAKEDKKQLFYTIYFLNYWLFAWATISFIVLSKDIITLFFGSKYVLDNDIVYIMAVNFYTLGLQSSVWMFNNTLGLFNYGKYLGLVTGGINLILSIILGKQYGLFGISFATFISRLVTNIWYSPYVLCRYGLKMNYYSFIKKYIMYSMQVITCFIITKFVLFVINTYLIEGFIIKIMICIFIPNIIFYLFNNKSPYIYILKKKLLWVIESRKKYVN